MNSKTWKNKALSLCLVITTITTYSMVALANPINVVGELLVSNNTPVQVNGKVAQNGNSIFSDSTIATSNNSDAVINLAKLGKVKLDSKSTIKLSFDTENFTSTLVDGKVTVMNYANEVNTKVNIGNVGTISLAPNTAVALSFDGKNITGQLLSGAVTTLNTSKSIVLTNVNGTVSKLNTGETAKARDDDDDNGGGGLATVGVIALIGGALGLILYNALDEDTVSLGGGSTVVSPTR